MKKKLGKAVRDSIIMAVSLLGIAALYRRLTKRRGPLVRVVVFHDVMDPEWFERMIAYLKSSYHVIASSDLSARNFDARKINVLVTFDDGYASWVRTCAPILSQHGVQALFFLNSGLLDVHGDAEAQRAYVRERLLLSPRETLSWEGASQIQSAGHVLGGHTARHARLSAMSAEEQASEIRADRSTIASKTGKAPYAFAYPFGRKSDYTEKTKELVRQAGYDLAFTTESAFVMVPYDAYEIPRLCLDSGLSERQLGRWVDGAYDIYAAIKRICAR